MALDVTSPQFQRAAKGLSHKQYKTLKAIYRAQKDGQKVTRHDFDGRVVRGLFKRGLLTLNWRDEKNWLHFTEAGLFVAEAVSNNPLSE